MAEAKTGLTDRDVLTALRSDTLTTREILERLKHGFRVTTTLRAELLDHLAALVESGKVEKRQRSRIGVSRGRGPDEYCNRKRR